MKNLFQKWGKLKTKIEVFCPEISMDDTRQEYVIKNLKDHLIQSFSYIEQNQICSNFIIITSLNYITSHANTHTYLIGHRSLDHTLSKQRNKIYSVKGRELT